MLWFPLAVGLLRAREGQPVWLNSRSLPRGVRGRRVAHRDPEPSYPSFDPPPPAHPPPVAEPAAHRDPVLWVHVHKCAGTLMCNVAQQAGERVVTPNMNCNWNSADGVMFMDRPSSEPTCEERRRYFDTNAFTWGAIEHELRDDHPCEGFLYGTMLREPFALVDSIASVHSHLNFERDSDAATSGGAPVRSTRDVLAPLKHGTGAFHKALLAVKARNAPLFEHIWNLQTWTYFDNFQTRVFANALDVPPGELTEAHFEKAQAALADFDVVVVLEDLDEEAPRFVDTFLWKQEILKSFAPKVNAKEQFSSGFEEAIFTLEEKELLRQANHFDQRLVNEYRSAGHKF